MTKQEIEIAISNFLHVLVYEAQFLSFQKKLLNNIKDNELKIFADLELKKISSCIKNGQYKKTDTLKFDKTVKIKEELPNSNDEIKVVQLNNRQERITVMSKKDLTSTFEKFTYRELAEKIDVQIEFLERLLKTKEVNTLLDANANISKDIWILIQDFVLNKLKIIETVKRKEKFNKASKLKRIVSSAPLRQYVGGNFGKLIFTGKTL